jgi:hypothetical protein
MRTVLTRIPILSGRSKRPVRECEEREMTLFARIPFLSVFCGGGSFACGRSPFARRVWYTHA